MTFDFSAPPGRLLPWYEQNRRDLPWRQDRERPPGERKAQAAPAQ